MNLITSNGDIGLNRLPADVMNYRVYLTLNAAVTPAKPVATALTHIKKHTTAIMPKTAAAWRRTLPTTVNISAAAEWI